MKAYTATTVVVFALIVVAHIVRVVAEGPRVLQQPTWVALTGVAALLAIWAGYLLKVAGRRRPLV